MSDRLTVLLSMLLAAGLALSGPSAHAGEKKEITYVKTYSQSFSKSTFTIGDVPNHEITQEVMRHVSKFSDPDFGPEEEWIHSQSDQIDGTGTHRGYYIQTHKGGEQTYGTFEGTHKTVAKEDGSWATTWEGKYRYVGGTGKYKNIKGTGTYKGRASPKEPIYEEGRETIEY
jgi:hypothetical protein